MNELKFHDRKAEREEFEAIACGAKTFFVKRLGAKSGADKVVFCKEDEDGKMCVEHDGDGELVGVGDEIIFCEVDPEGEYTGRTIAAFASFVEMVDANEERFEVVALMINRWAKVRGECLVLEAVADREIEE